MKRVVMAEEEVVVVVMVVVVVVVVADTPCRPRHHAPSAAIPEPPLVTIRRRVDEVLQVLASHEASRRETKLRFSLTALSLRGRSWRLQREALEMAVLHHTYWSMRKGVDALLLLSLP